MTNPEQPNSSEEAPLEIERKFIVTYVGLVALLNSGVEINSFPCAHIEQGYLANTDHEAIRVRRKDDTYFLTFKRNAGDHAASRIELETEITKEQFDTMWPGTVGRRVEKVRYKIPTPDKQHTVELDFFQDVNAGFMLAEIEFGSTDEADAFEPPFWFGEEVTSDASFGNANIAEFGFPGRRPED